MSKNPTAIQFELASLVDAISRAARVAPTRGVALEKSAGVVIIGDPQATGDPVTVMATDLDVSFRTTIPVLEMCQHRVQWRLPSTLLSGIMSNLDAGEGSEVLMMQHGDNEVRFKSGKTKARLNLIMGDYPVVQEFDPTGMADAPNLAQRLRQVAWATTQKSVDVLAGIHIDGTNIYGCDRTALAVVPCQVPLKSPVTAQLSTVAPSLRNTDSVAVRATETRFEMMPDDHTQVTSLLIADPYPEVQKLLRDDHSGTITVSAETLQNVLDRMKVIGKNERSTAMGFVIGNGTVEMRMDSDNVGTVVDEFDVTGGETSEPFKMRFNSELLSNALAASGRPLVNFKYGPSNMQAVELTDDTGYQAVLMPMRPE